MGLNLEQWLTLMESPTVYGDELMLYALARTYQQHVVVFNKHKCWCTICSDDYITGQHLLELCEIQLVYIGRHMFAELRCKPFEMEKKPVVLDSPKSNIHGLACTESTTDQSTPLDLCSVVEKITTSNDDATDTRFSDHESICSELSETNIETIPTLQKHQVSSVDSNSDATSNGDTILGTNNIEVCPESMKLSSPEDHSSGNISDGQKKCDGHKPHLPTQLHHEVIGINEDQVPHYIQKDLSDGTKSDGHERS